MNRGDIWLIDLGRKIGSKAYKIMGTLDSTTMREVSKKVILALELESSI